MNLREKILNAKDIKEELVKIEEWDVEVIVKSMTGLERANFLKNSAGKDGSFDFEKLYPQLVIATTFDPETGEKLFSKEDRDILNSKSAGAIEKIAKIALKMSGLGDDSMDDIKKK